MSYIDAVKLPYHGVLIERPCSNCDTCDLHYEGECYSGACQHPGCGQKRGAHYSWADDHAYLPGHYQPALIKDAPLAFDEMIDVVAQTGMPSHFMSDLYRDYQILTRDGAPDRFIWAVRSTGTDLLSGDTNADLANAFIERSEKLYHWNGYSLAWVNRDTAKALLAVYRVGVPRGWDLVEA